MFAAEVGRMRSKFNEWDGVINISKAGDRMFPNVRYVYFSGTSSDHGIRVLMSFVSTAEVYFGRLDLGKSQ